MAVSGWFDIAYTHTLQCIACHWLVVFRTISTDSSLVKMRVRTHFSQEALKIFLLLR